MKNHLNPNKHWFSVVVEHPNRDEQLAFDGYIDRDDEAPLDIENIEAETIQPRDDDWPDLIDACEEEIREKVNQYLADSYDDYMEGLAR